METASVKPGPEPAMSVSEAQARQIRAASSASHARANCTPQELKSLIPGEVLDPWSGITSRSLSWQIRHTKNVLWNLSCQARQCLSLSVKHDVDVLKFCFFLRPVLYAVYDGDVCFFVFLLDSICVCLMPHLTFTFVICIRAIRVHAN